MKLAFENDEIVTGVMEKRVKGGMIVNLYGIDAFLPGSQIALKPIPNLDQFIGREYKFKIIKLEIERKNIIVSRKRVIELEKAEMKSELNEKMVVGAELDGEV